MDPALLSRAIQLAVENVRNGAGGPFGAVVAKDGKVIAEGVNLVIRKRDPTAHAEVVAIRNACQALGAFHIPGCEIYTSCEPCPMCLAAIYWAHIGRIYYAATRQQAAEAEFDDSFLYQQMALAPEARSVSMVRVATAEAEEPFKEWMANPGRIRY